MKESELKSQLIRSFEHFYPGCVAFKVGAGPYLAAGLPDLYAALPGVSAAGHSWTDGHDCVNCRSPRLLWIEVKMHPKKLSPRQETMIRRLRAADAKVWVLIFDPKSGVLLVDGPSKTASLAKSGALWDIRSLVE